MRIGFAVAFIALLLPLCSAGDWPMLGHDLSRTSFALFNDSYSDSDLALKWSFNASSGIRASPVAADLDGDGSLEIVFPAGNVLHAIRSDGSLWWTYAANGTIRSSAALGDLDGDNATEVVFASDDGVLRVLSGDGKLLWSFPTAGRIVVSPVLADLNGDRRLEVFFASWDGFFYDLDYDGRFIWKYLVGSRVESSPAIGDIDNDDSGEIIFGCDNNVLYVLDFPPSKVWMYQANSNIIASPTAVDVNNDGKVEIVFGSDDGTVYAVYYSLYSDSEGGEFSRLSLLWNYSAGGSVATSVAASDLDSAGGLELAFGSKDKTLYVLNSTGERILRYTVSKPVLSSPILVDLDGDAHPEIIFGSDDKSVYAINSSGSTFWSFKTNGLVRSSPIAVDLENSREVNVVVGSDDGILYAFQSRRAHIKSVGNGFYSLAEKYYAENEINLSREYALKANETFYNITYSEGLLEVKGLLGRISALDYCIKAGEAYERGDLEASIAFATESDRVYSGLNLGNVSVCSMLLSRSNADLYHKEAKFLYDAGRYTESVKYANEARKIYVVLNNTHALGEVDVLLNRTVFCSRAESYYKQAFVYYLNGSLDVAKSYNKEAVSLYSAFGCEKGLNDSLALDVRFNASLFLLRAWLYYNGSSFAEARYSAAEAFRLFEAINDSSGMAMASDILNNTEDFCSKFKGVNCSGFVGIPADNSSQIDALGYSSQDELSLKDVLLLVLFWLVLTSSGVFIAFRIIKRYAG